MERIILKALAKKPEDRFESGGDLALALRGVEVETEQPKPRLATRLRSWLQDTGATGIGAGGVEGGAFSGFPSVFESVYQSQLDFTDSPCHIYFTRASLDTVEDRAAAPDAINIVEYT